MSDAKHIRIFSDIHLDFDIPHGLKNFDPDRDIWTPKPLSTDPNTILILAGDIWHAKKPFKFMNFSWFAKISKQFHSIIVVLGNHDFWGGNLQKEYRHYQDEIIGQKLHNIYLLQNNSILIGNNKFIGGTLWTDYNKGNDYAMELAERQMNDFKYIRNGMTFSKLRAKHLLGEHIKTTRYISENSKKDFPEQNLWVITHHPPTFSSIPAEYEDFSEIENGAYASDLNHLFTEDLDVWVHGHTHHCVNYKLNNTNVISNPRGYRMETTNYNEDDIFDLKGKII